MTRDEIEKAAIAAGLIRIASKHAYGPPLDSLEKFANLVAAVEREACAKMYDQIAACCRDENSDDEPFKWVASAIRARGNTE